MALTLTGGRLRRLLVPLAVLLGTAILVFGLRTGVSLVESRQQPVGHVDPRTAPMPVSPQIEEQWGIRFTVVQLLADNGLVELRYVVLDNNKANRLHSDSTSLANLPTVLVEGTGQVVRSNSLMFHIHHEWDQGTDGRDYSFVYGNAGGAIHPAARVTIAMPDGLKLQHVPVYG
jgi:hypothetical protein